MAFHKFHYYQQDAFDSIVNNVTSDPSNARGRIVIPTGGGKTMVQARALLWMFENINPTGIYLVMVPRIMLGNQLIKEYKEFLGAKSFRAIAFHSGEHQAEDGEPWKEEATLSTSKVLETHQNAQKIGQPLVVFSTYHSCNKLVGIDFDGNINDEAQYIVAEHFNNSFRSLTLPIAISFTATEKHTASDNGLGMNNEQVFGPRWYEISSTELIKGGYIVPPRLHVMEATAEEDAQSVVSQVVEITKEQIKLTEPTLGFSKILFAMRGTDDVKTVEDNLHILRTEFPKHDVFTITSKNGSRINGRKLKRKDFLKLLKDVDNCIILHYDILSEGIDVPGITGVGIMRNMSLSKLLQTIGRAVRVYRPDPSKKAQAWISVPVINGDEDDKERLAGIIRTLRNGGYDISAETIYETKQDRHQGDEENVDDAFEKDKKNKSSVLVEDVMHLIEADEFWFRFEETEGVREKFEMFFKDEKHEAQI